MKNEELKMIKNECGTMNALVVSSQQVKNEPENWRNGEPVKKRVLSQILPLSGSPFLS
jgi:hypothetical protein